MSEKKRNLGEIMAALLEDEAAPVNTAPADTSMGITTDSIGDPSNCIGTKGKLNKKLTRVQRPVVPTPKRSTAKKTAVKKKPGLDDIRKRVAAKKKRK